MSWPFLIWPLSVQVERDEISSPSTCTDTDDCIVLYYVISFSDNCIQPDDDQIRNGPNM